MYKASEIFSSSRLKFADGSSTARELTSNYLPLWWQSLRDNIEIDPVFQMGYFKWWSREWYISMDIPRLNSGWILPKCSQETHNSREYCPTLNHFTTILCSSSSHGLSSATSKTTDPQIVKPSETRRITKREEKATGISSFLTLAYVVVCCEASGFGLPTYPFHDRVFKITVKSTLFSKWIVSYSFKGVIYRSG